MAKHGYVHRQGSVYNSKEKQLETDIFARKLRKHLYKFDNGVIIEAVDFEYKEMRGK